MYRKNVSGQFVYFCLVNASTGAALTGATVTAYRALDNGAQATATGTTTELANGQYRYNLSQADTNGNYGSYLFVATNAVPVEKTVVFTGADPTDAAAFGLSRLDQTVGSRMATYTQPTGFLAADFTRLDAAVSSRMATYTQPTGFLAATFPTTVASPTNITSASGVTLAAVTHTGAVIPTVTSVTNGVTVSTNNDKTGYSLSVAPLTAAQTASAVWDALLTSYTVAGSFGARVLRSTGTANAITASAGGIFVVGDMFGNNLVIPNLATQSQIPAEFTSATFANTGVFSTAALANAPGGSGDWSSNERTAIRSILGFDSGGTVSLPTVGVLDGIKDKTDLITSGSISVLPDRVNDNTITMQFNEVTTATVNLDENTTSATLQFVVQRPDGSDVLSIANASITRNATSFTVTITTAVTGIIGQYLWSLRDLTGGGNRVVTKGVLSVQNAASIDA